MCRFKKLDDNLKEKKKSIGYSNFTLVSPHYFCVKG